MSFLAPGTGKRTADAWTRAIRGSTTTGTGCWGSKSSAFWTASAENEGKTWGNGWFLDPKHYFSDSFRACEGIPYTLTIFPEGTRLTEGKLRDSQALDMESVDLFCCLKVYKAHSTSSFLTYIYLV